MASALSPIPEETTEHALEGGQTHSWTFELEADQVVTVRVEQAGIDVALRLGPPATRDDEPRLEMDGPYGSWGVEELTWVADTPGAYRLEITSDHQDVAPGRYLFWSSKPRAATDAEREHAALLAELCRADVARRSGGHGNLIDARARYRKALAGWRQLEDVVWQLQALQRLGATAEILDEGEAALAAYTEARDLALAAENASEAIRNENRLTRLAFDRQDLDQARAHIDRGLELAERHGDPALLAFAENNQAAWLYRTGEIDQAVSALLELSDRWRELARPLEQADALQNLASILDSQGKSTEAIDAFERCAAARKAGGDEAGRLAALVSLGGARLRAGDPKGALAALREARPELEGRLGGKWSARASHFEGLALAESAAGSSDDSPRRFAEAIERFEEAAAKAEEIGDPHLVAEIQVNLGAVYLETSEPDSALEQFERALGQLERQQSPRDAAMARLGMGLALRQKGELTPALSQFVKATAGVESARLTSASWDLRSAFLSSRHSYFEELVDLLVELHLQGERPAGDSTYAERALETVERWRARTFLDSVEERAQLRSDVAPELLEQERIVSEQLRQVESDLRPNGPGESLLTAESRKQELLRRLDTIRTRIREQHPQFADVTRPAPLSATAIRNRLLDDSSLLLAYALGERRSFVFRVDPHREVEVFPLQGRDHLARAVEAGRLWMPARSGVKTRGRDAALERLADELLEPLYGRLDAKRLVIVPSGLIELVPFAALRIPQPAGVGDAGDAGNERSYLLEHHEVVFLPSASSLDALRREQPYRARPGWELALFGDPVFSSDDPRVVGSGSGPAPLPESVRRAAAAAGLDAGLPRLSFTDNEVRAIGELLVPELTHCAVGFDARKDESFLEYLQGSRIVHLATHGIVDGHLPELSALALSLVDETGEPTDGFLYAYELYSMRLTADLVVLSACRTGVGPELRGEGIRGLSRAFLYAGAPRVVMSLWNVGDASTADLMAGFYRQLLGERLEPAAALRAAQLELLRSERWSAPAHWAAFVLVGDWLDRPRADGGPDASIEKDDGGPVIIDPGGKGGAFPMVPDDLPDAEPDSDPSDADVSDADLSPARSAESRRSGSRRRPSFNPDAYVNGLDADTGRLLEPHPDGATLLAHHEALELHPRLQRQLQWWKEHHALDDPERLPVYSVDPDRIDQAGWAVLYAPGVTDEVKEALAPLLTLRRRQAGKLFQELDLPEGIDSQHFRFDFLPKPIGFGPADPERLPYYLLIVGDPRELSFELQYGLDVQYAVGRLHFDAVDDYARYASTVKHFENSTTEPVRKAAIFGVSGTSDNDRHLIEALVDPLTRYLRRKAKVPGQPIFRSGGDSKADFARLLDSPPGFLFAAGHGLRIPDPSHHTLPKRQGALVCSDYLEKGGVTEDSYFTGDDLSTRARLRGLVAFLFACYSAGMPKRDDFPDGGLGKPRQIAPYPMVSHLAKRMLSQGAQAVVGHVDRAWGTSFDWSSREGDQIRVFSSACHQLLDGGRLGHAMEWINQRYAESATTFNDFLRGGFVPPEKRNLLARVRKATLDARNYLVIGDPAVRLPGMCIG